MLSRAAARVIFFPPAVRFQSTTRAFAPYRIRKPEALLEVSVRHAKFKAVGARGNFFSAVGTGSVRLALSPAAGAPSAGSPFPAYDYASKIFVDVTALDIVTIIQSPVVQPVRGRGCAQ